MSLTTQPQVSELFFEQYKILVNSYEALQTKRANINNFLIIMYSSIIGLYSFIDNTRSSSFKSSISIYCLAISISITWVAIILKCIQAEKTKYRMVQDAESQLPMKIFTRQNSDNYLFNSKILSTAAIELMIPIFLLVLFSVNLYSILRGTSKLF